MIWLMILISWLTLNCISECFSLKMEEELTIGRVLGILTRYILWGILIAKIVKEF